MSGAHWPVPLPSAQPVHLLACTVVRCWAQPVRASPHLPVAQDGRGLHKHRQWRVPQHTGVPLVLGVSLVVKASHTGDRLVAGQRRAGCAAAARAALGASPAIRAATGGGGLVHGVCGGAADGVDVGACQVGWEAVGGGDGREGGGGRRGGGLWLCGGAEGAVC
jgi:hypothetical protein